MRLRTVCLGAMIILLGHTAMAADLAEAIKQVRSVGPKGANHRAAQSAWKDVAAADSGQLITVLAGMDGASELASNWLRPAVETIADRAIRSGDGLPKAALEKFVRDTSHSPRPRRLAFELLARVDSTARERIIPTLNRDPSLELRRDAIAMEIAKAEAFEKDDRKDRARQSLQQTLTNARDVDQIKSIAEKLTKLDAKPDLPSQFGFLMQWQLIGPFDNRDKRGFDVAYPPEREIDLNGSYEGMKGQVKWTQAATDDDFGVLDLNKAMTKHKGAICYAYTEFNSAEARDCEIRIGCINGNKVWLNGKLIIANHVYHAGMDIDQYRGAGKLRKGKNQILIKVCQNEQEEQWAQRWQFQLRVCDSLGTAILAKDRRIPKAALRLNENADAIARR